MGLTQSLYYPYQRDIIPLYYQFLYDCCEMNINNYVPVSTFISAFATYLRMRDYPKHKYNYYEYVKKNWMSFLVISETPYQISCGNKVIMGLSVKRFTPITYTQL